MKKTFLMLILVTMIGLIQADIEFEKLERDLIVHYTNNGDLLKNSEYTVAIPALNPQIVVEECLVNDLDRDGNRVGSRSIDGSELVKLTDSFVMRDLYGHRISIVNNLQTERGSSVVSELKFSIVSTDEIPVPQKISSAFLPVYKQFADNFNRSYLISAQIEPSRMLVISPNNAILLSYLTQFEQWKEARGIDTEVVTLEDTGASSSDIKNYLQNLYDTEDNPPDYVVLVGDLEEQSDPYHMPSFFIGAEQNVTDHPFTLLEGNDYFPEMLIGRFSIDDAQDLFTIVSKILTYEKEPYMTDPSWFQKALLVAGNYSGSPPVPITPVYISRWLEEKLVNYGYDEVHEVYYPPTYPGTDQIINAINEGVGIVSYRGWGNANGWEFPDFDRNDIADLSNGPRLPVVTSIVCNTCDFANSVDPCFGEAFIQKNNGGCVSIVGPSDLHTSTKFNNAIFAGFYSGLLDENIFTFGTAVLRGKLELYENYPLDREPDGQVEFYYNVYNILGDPSLCMWTTTPEEIFCELPETVSLGMNHLELDLPGLDGGIATASKSGEFTDSRMIENSSVTLFLDPQSVGDIEITVTKANHKPFIGSVEVIQEAVDVGLESISYGNDLIAGNVVDLSVTLKNYGDQPAGSVAAELTTGSPLISINDNSGDFGDLDPGESASDDYQFTIASECPDQETVEFELEISTGAIAKIEMIVSSMLMEITGFTVNDANGFLDPGESSQIEVTVENVGSVNSNSIVADVTSLCSAVEVTSGSMDLGDLSTGDNASGSFDVSVDADCVIGRQASFELLLTDSDGRMTTAYFTIEIGEVTNTAPTGPDSYGYYAYDSFDVDNNNDPFPETPSYFWVEIDPDEGGSGSVFELGDDSSVSIELPFDFTYYGIEYDSLTICTNGWISFETTWFTNFRNWTIPCPIGPYAMVAAYWDDLIGHPNGNSHDPMRICHFYDEDEDRFIIEWNDCVNRHDDSSVEKFEIVLYDPDVYTTQDGNGEIQVNYQTVSNPDDNGNYSTVGIENHFQSDGLLYSYADLYPGSATPLQDGLAIKFTTDPPDTFTPADDDLMAPGFRLVGNYPNPFNPTTEIKYQLAETGEVVLSIYNLKGQLVKNLVSEIRPAGENSATWDGTDNKNLPVASGIYLYRLEAGRNTAVKKCILMK